MTLPQCERVVALHFGGSVANQEGPIRHVSELIIHLLPGDKTEQKREKKSSV